MVTLADASATRAFGRRLAGHLRPGDLVLLVGQLGAGKTTLAQGIGEGLGVRGPIVSPTFIIARTHPSERGGPPLIHVDAYRLGSLTELDDLDLDESVDASVTVGEWGEGLAEVLTDSHLTVRIDRGRGGGEVDSGSGPRRVTIETVGDRWAGVELEEVGAA
jgi:tRNA threonylcarbamoyladenosine biosynthesis protein TsaE